MTTHDSDLAQWAFDQAAALRAGRMSDLDLTNLADEIEDLGKNEQRMVESYLENLLMHLLKWQAQPVRRSSSWRATINVARKRLARHARSGMLARHLQDEFHAGDVYEYARVAASNETGLEPVIFPPVCPWSFDDVMNSDFFPGSP
jgi:hypothetical protein